jgi:excisionase family DNA binding protein
MAAAELREETYLPTDTDRPELAKIFEFVQAHPVAKRKPAHLLVGPDQSEAIPAEVYRILRQVIEAMNQGLAVTVVPQSQTLTTQQAADLLGISRPTLIRLLDEDRIPYERVGTHRRLLLRDVLEYREERRTAQYRFLDETAVHPEDEEDLDLVLERMRQARKRVATRQNDIERR